MPSSSVSEDAKAVYWPRMFRWRARPSRASCSSGWGLDDGTFIFQLRRSETWNNAMYRIWSIYGSSAFVVARRQRLCQRLCPAFFHISIASISVGSAVSTCRICQSLLKPLCDLSKALSKRTSGLVTTETVLNSYLKGRYRWDESKNPMVFFVAGREKPSKKHPKFGTWCLFQFLLLRWYPI